MDILNLFSRISEFFTEDIAKYETELSKMVRSSIFFVADGTGSIHQSVVKKVFKRKPQKLHMVDISENNMVELVRDIFLPHNK